MTARGKLVQQLEGQDQWAKVMEKKAQLEQAGQQYGERLQHRLVARHRSRARAATQTISFTYQRLSLTTVTKLVNSLGFVSVDFDKTYVGMKDV